MPLPWIPHWLCCTWVSFEQWDKTVGNCVWYLPHAIYVLSLLPPQRIFFYFSPTSLEYQCSFWTSSKKVWSLRPPSPHLEISNDPPCGGFSETTPFNLHLTRGCNYILNSTVVSCYFNILIYHSIPSIGACFLWQIWIFCLPLFVEREENVKADIFAAYITLLRQTRPVASQTLDADAMEDDSG